MDAFIAGFCKVQFLCYDDGYDGASPTKSCCICFIFVFCDLTTFINLFLAIIIQQTIPHANSFNLKVPDIISLNTNHQSQTKNYKQIC